MAKAIAIETPGCIYIYQVYSRSGLAKRGFQLGDIVLAQLLLEDVLEPFFQVHRSIFGLELQAFLEEFTESLQHAFLEDSNFIVFGQGTSPCQSGPGCPPSLQADGGEGCGLALFPDILVLVPGDHGQDVAVQPGHTIFV
jgi:hypothetical protein